MCFVKDFKLRSDLVVEIEVDKNSFGRWYDFDLRLASYKFDEDLYVIILSLFKFYIAINVYRAQ